MALPDLLKRHTRRQIQAMLLWLRAQNDPSLLRLPLTEEEKQSKIKAAKQRAFHRVGLK